ncbi:MAG: hypothetical protein F6K26_07195 [Moorea sp. SIO2I5]|nr:hypothetical protein [Moorena sp. SIO2I5]
MNRSRVGILPAQKYSDAARSWGFPPLALCIKTLKLARCQFHARCPFHLTLEIMALFSNARKLSSSSKILRNQLR